MTIIFKNLCEYYRKYKDLYYIFIWKEFSIRYKQTSLGVIWAVLQPLSLMGLFTVIFTYIMPVKISNVPQPVFFYAGLLPWTFFSSSMNYSISSLTNNFDLIRKIYFPREILPVSRIVVAFIDFMIASGIFVVLLAVHRIPLNWSTLYFFPLVGLLVLFTVSFSLIFTIMNVYYRDVQLAINFLLQLWFFMTPVFYSTTQIPAKYKMLVSLNPLCFIIDGMRKSVVEGLLPSWKEFSFMLCYAIVLLIISYRVFKAAERKFADVL
ncbi:MAG: ABC transporter permease [Candidatus Omnitrophica bacterium]|nr:ABC transporter permease [Candidatus Omnitrophota bacterium]